MNRSERRHRANIRQRKSDNIRKAWSWESKNPRHRGISRDTFSSCSCYMCCNRRKIEGLSLQERRNKEDWQSGNAAVC